MIITDRSALSAPQRAALSNGILEDEQMPPSFLVAKVIHPSIPLWKNGDSNDTSTRHTAHVFSPFVDASAVFLEHGSGLPRLQDHLPASFQRVSELKERILIPFTTQLTAPTLCGFPVLLPGTTTPLLGDQVRNTNRGRVNWEDSLHKANR